jgi:hypothetical protein
MALFETLTPAERARQLANPEGAVGLAVADWLNEINKPANAKIIGLLNVKPGARCSRLGLAMAAWRLR